MGSGPKYRIVKHLHVFKARMRRLKATTRGTQIKATSMSAPEGIEVPCTFRSRAFAECTSRRHCHVNVVLVTFNIIQNA